MSKQVSIGDTIQTPYGSAVIVKIMNEKISVRLESGPLAGQIIPLSPDDLKKMDISIKNYQKDVKDEVNEKAIRDQKTKTEEKTDRRLDLTNKKIFCIDSLRFGLVPVTDIDQLTIGFDKIHKWTLQSLPYKNGKEKQVAHQILGHYGNGKSHMMSVIRQIAYHEGYITARVEVDGRNISLADPNSFLYALLTSIKGKNLDISSPLLSLYKKAIQTRYDPPEITPEKPDRINTIYNLIHQLIRQGNLDELDYVLDAVLTCSDEMTASDARYIIKQKTNWRFVNIYPMIGRTVSDRHKNFLETLIGTTLIAKQAGYKGLIITIDEYEVESAHLSTFTRIARECDFLDLAVDFFSEETAYQNVPLALYFATVPMEEDTTEEYSYLTKTAGFTERVNRMVNNSGGHTYTLDEFGGYNQNDKDIKTIVGRIYSMYCDAYKWNDVSLDTICDILSEKLRDMSNTDSGGIRSFMKQYISVLDSYGPPKF